ncbi:MAG: tyrosine-type recombinase/integrase [Planctomycetota bacterium]|jgi:integrase
MTTAEVERLLAASPGHWRDIWYAFLVTGMRASELINLRLSDIDWESQEVVVQRGIAKNHTSRRIPVDNALREILCRRCNGRSAEDLAFTNMRGGSLHRRALYQAFIRWRAEIQTRTLDGEGQEVDHIDVHSLRRTFATDLIVNGADPKTVQELLGHKTLAMTMNLYAKIHTGTKRQAIGRLSYGAGTKAPDYVVELPARAKRGHKMSTVAKTSSQRVAAQ